MEHELQTLIKSRLRTQVMDALHRENPLEVPRSMLEREMQALQIDQGRRAGVKDPAQLQPIESFRELAQRRTALGLILTHIVESEKLRPDAQQIEQRVNDEAARYQDPDSARTAIKASREMMDQIVSVVMEGQVVEWVLEHATIKEVPRTFSEVTGFGREMRQDDNAEKSS
jgi:trigger factor